MISPTLKWTVPLRLRSPCATAARRHARPAPPAGQARDRGRRSPACSGGDAPKGTRVPSGKMITGRPPAIAAFASAIMFRSAAGAGLPVDPDHAVAAGHPAEQRNGGQLALHHDHRGRGEVERVDRLHHRLMLDRDQIGAVGNRPVPFDADAEHVAHQPMVKLRPAVDHRLHRRIADRRHGDHRQDVEQGARIEEQHEQQRADERPSDIEPHAEAAEQIFIIFGEQGHEDGLGLHRVGDDRDIARRAGD